MTDKEREALMIEDIFTLYRRGLLSMIMAAGHTFLQLREIPTQRDWFHAGLANHHVDGGTAPNRLGQLYLSLQEEHEDNVFQIEGVSWYGRP